MQGSGVVRRLAGVRDRILRSARAWCWLLATLAVLASACTTQPAAKGSTSSTSASLATTTSLTTPVSSSSLPAHRCAPDPHCASPDVRRFVALANRGLDRSFVATYRYLGTRPPLFGFTYATSGRRRGSNQHRYEYGSNQYRYAASADGLEYEFVSSTKGSFDCLKRETWSCGGPMPMFGNGGLAVLLSYDMAPDYLLFFDPPEHASTITTHGLAGLRLTCLTYAPHPQSAPNTWCITPQGVLGRFTGPSVLHQVALVSLSYGLPPGEFTLPTQPTKWKGVFVERQYPEFAPPGFADS
jgi:hypothetical protein